MSDQANGREVRRRFSVRGIGRRGRGQPPSFERTALLAALDQSAVAGVPSVRVRRWGTVWLVVAAVWCLVSFYIPALVLIGTDHDWRPFYEQATSNGLAPWWVFRDLAYRTYIGNSSLDYVGLGLVVAVFGCAAWSFRSATAWRWPVRILVVVKLVAFVSEVGWIVGDASFLDFGVRVRWIIASLLTDVGLVLLLARALSEAFVPVFNLRRRLTGRIARGALRWLGLTTVSITNAGLRSLTGGAGAVVAWLVVAAPAYWLARRVSRAILAARRRGAPDARELLAYDGRPPILYLRSFRSDEEHQRAVSERSDFLLTWEESLLRPFARHGPVVAIGKPGEPLPGLGAARLYVADERWQAVVSLLMDASQLIVVHAGGSAGLAWEIAHAASTQSPSKLLLVNVVVDGGPPTETRSNAREFSYPDALGLLPEPLRAVVPSKVGGSSLLSFESRSGSWAVRQTPVRLTGSDSWLRPRRLKISRREVRAIVDGARGGAIVATPSGFNGRK